MGYYDAWMDKLLVGRGEELVVVGIWVSRMGLLWGD